MRLRLRRVSSRTSILVASAPSSFSPPASGGSSPPAMVVSPISARVSREQPTHAGKFGVSGTSSSHASLRGSERPSPSPRDGQQQRKVSKPNKSCCVWLWLGDQRSELLRELRERGPQLRETWVKKGDLKRTWELRRRKTERSAGSQRARHTRLDSTQLDSNREGLARLEQEIIEIG